MAEPAVTTSSEKRFHVNCESCGTLGAGLPFTSGLMTQSAADIAAETHRAAHRAQPSCICESTCMDFFEDHLCDDDCGHSHCGRHAGPCCECGCLTKQTGDHHG